MKRGTDSYAARLRGGSFNNNHQNVRCAYRNRNNPDNRNNNLGFRVVLLTFFFTGICRRDNFLPARSEKRRNLFLAALPWAGE